MSRQARVSHPRGKYGTFSRRTLNDHIISQIDELTALFAEYESELANFREQKFVGGIDEFERIRAESKNKVKKTPREGKIYILEYIARNKT
jgi:hypothetical protein